MCGIIGCVINKMSLNVTKNLYDLFTNQKGRGIDGAGISINSKDSMYRFRSFSPFRVFNAYNISIWDRIKKGDRVLFHHRFPTSSPNKPFFNHPIANEDDSIHLIHNGVLYNYMQIYDDLKGSHGFETYDEKTKKFTDTEVLLHTFEEGLAKNENDISKALRYMYDEVSGSFAVAIHIKGDENIYLVRHSYPVIISEDSNGNQYFSSEYKAMNDLKFVYELEQGEIGMLNKKGYHEMSKEDAGVYQPTLNYWNRNRPEYDAEDYTETVKLGDDIEKFIIKATKKIRKNKPKVSYSKLCLHVFSELDNQFPSIDIENHEVRIAIREIIDEASG